MLLKFAVKDFLTEKKFKNLSRYTLDMYTRNLRMFSDYCLNQSVTLVTGVKRNHIKQFLYYCQEELGNVNSTINNKIRSLKAFFNYCEEEEIIEENPTKKIKQSKEVSRIEVPSDEEIKQLVKYWERQGYKYSHFHATRNRMLIIFFISTGARLGEANNLR